MDSSFIEHLFSGANSYIKISQLYSKFNVSYAEKSA